MKTAIKIATEIKEQLASTSVDNWEAHLDKLKPEINNMLQMFLPKETTVNEMEIVGCLIFDIVTDPTKYTAGLAIPLQTTKK